MVSTLAAPCVFLSFTSHPAPTNYTSIPARPEQIGRKTTITMASIPFALSWAWIALTSSFSELTFARFMVGLMVGIVSMAVPLYIGETAPTHRRGGLGAVNQFGITVGILAAYVVGIVVEKTQATDIRCVDSPNDNLNSLRLGSDTHAGLSCDDVVAGWTCKRANENAEFFYCQGSLPEWRVLAWIAAAASGFLFLCMAFMPETPNYLFKSGRPDLARASLLFLRGGSVVHADFEIKELERAAFDSA